MVLKPLSTENITLAALFRVIEMWQPTLLIDEADSFLKREDGRDNEELRGIMNAGHARGGEVIRTVGEDHEPRCFKVYAPIAFAWLVRKGRHAPETLEDRSITIELRRRLKEEKITRLRSNRMGHLEVLGRQAVRWAMDHRNLLSDADPELPEELGDRAQDNWRMLIAIADAISVKLGEQARTAAKKIAEEHVGIEDDHSVQALADVAAIAKIEAVPLKQKAPGGEWLKGISSGDLVNALIKMEDRPWSEWRRGQPLTKTSLARLLKPFNIRPRTILFPGRPPGQPDHYAKGYDVGAIEEANRRFVDKETEDVVEPF